MRKTLQALLITAGLCWGAGALAAVEIAGVKLEESITVAGTSLQLNGAGIRYKGPFRVYVGDLYTTRPVKSLAAHAMPQSGAIDALILTKTNARATVHRPGYMD